NAKTESDSTPRSIDASTVRRSARVPARWPAAVGRRRRRAQRELPSMMIATERATSGSSGSCTGRSGRRLRSRVRRFTRLDLQDFGFLALQQLVDLVHVVVGELLRALLRPALLVVAHFPFANQLLQVLHQVATHVPDRNTSVL